MLPCDQQLRLWMDVVLNQKMSFVNRCCCWSNIAFMNILFNQQLHIWLDCSFDQALQIWRDVCFWSTVAFMNRYLCSIKKGIHLFLFDQTVHLWLDGGLIKRCIFEYIFWSNAALMTRCLFYQPLHFWIDTFWSNTALVIRWLCDQTLYWEIYCLTKNCIYGISVYLITHRIYEKMVAVLSKAAFIDRWLFDQKSHLQMEGFFFHQQLHLWPVGLQIPKYGQMQGFLSCWLLTSASNYNIVANRSGFLYIYSLIPELWLFSCLSDMCCSKADENIHKINEFLTLIIFCCYIFFIFFLALFLQFAHFQSIQINSSHSKQIVFFCFSLRAFCLLMFCDNSLLKNYLLWANETIRKSATLYDWSFLLVPMLYQFQRNQYHQTNQDMKSIIFLIFILFFRCDHLYFEHVVQGKHTLKKYKKS